MTDRVQEFSDHPHGDAFGVGSTHPVADGDGEAGPLVAVTTCVDHHGYGPATGGSFAQRDYHHPAAAWGAARAVTKVLAQTREPLRGAWSMVTMNHPGHGFDCPGCAWPDDPGVTLDICENGIKHVTWEMVHERTTPEFFATHTVSELRGWTDHALEAQGRLTHPMRYDAATDRYLACSWDEAFALVGAHLQALDDPNRATFYTSGRLSNEGSHLIQLVAREFGTNNLPDCSNMCHEASGRGLQASLGTGVGTADLHDWATADALFVMGVNAASNAPRMLTSLAEAHRRGAEIVHVNTLKEVGSTDTIIPHEIGRMARNSATPVGTLDVQVRPGGDLALLRGMAKAVFEAEASRGGVLDTEFLARHTHGVDGYRVLVEGTSWEELERQSGVPRAQIENAARIYVEADRTIISWCLGISQHEHAVDTTREIVNLLLLRGNVGRAGAGPSPVRGHSNVQGNRTCGIDHRPKQDFLDALEKRYGFTPPTQWGRDVTASLKGMHDGDVTVFVGMGGNFARATPDPLYTEEALGNCALTVQVSTKLNRSHLAHGRDALILPCLGRTELDLQAGGPQSVSCEDAMSSIQLSKGSKKPASSLLRSEPAILAGIAKAAIPDTVVDWDALVADYDRIRDGLAATNPRLEDYNVKVRREMGFRVLQPARERVFLTESGRAEFSTAELPDVIPDDPDLLVLQTMRTQDQWNTTIYTNDDRYRGVENIRTVVFLHPDDLAARGLAQWDRVDVESVSKDGTRRRLEGFRAMAYDTPVGSAAGYMPEMNVLIGPADYSAQSDQPLMKSIKVYVTKAAAAE